MLASPTDTISSAIDSMRSDLVRITKELIRFRTTRLTGTDFLECSEYLRATYAGLGFVANIVEVPEDLRRELDGEASHYRALGQTDPIAPRYNVLASRSGTGGGSSLHINGHFCVVEPLGDWTADPFEPREVNGHIVGRGAIDMKSGLAATIVALRALQTAEVRPRGDLHLSATIDTHFGGDLGAGFVARNGLGRADRVIVTDTSGPSCILLGYRGQLWMDVLVDGATAHGSTPEYGKNPATIVAELLLGLEELRERLQTRPSKWPIRPVSSRHPSLTPGTMMSSSKMVNTVPAQYRIGIDRRLIPEETVESAVAEIAVVIDGVRRQHPSTNIELRQLFGVPGTATARDDDLVTTVASHIRGITGKEPDIFVHPAFLDLQWFTTAWGVPGIVYGPGEGGAATDFKRKPYTEADEQVAIDDIVAATKVIAMSIADLTA